MPVAAVVVIVAVIMAVPMMAGVSVGVIVRRLGNQRGMCAIVRAGSGWVGVHGIAVRIVIQGHRQL